METIYDVIVVGSGLFGSAAAKYAAEEFPNGSTLLVGPGAGLENDPQLSCFGLKLHSDEDNLLGGAWHDEGRISKLFEHGHAWQSFGKLVCRFG